MTKDIGSESPAESPNDDQYKSKRGRKPSQARLAMEESKKLFAEKRKLIDSNVSTEANGRKNVKKKKIMEYGKTKKGNEGGNAPKMKIKRRNLKSTNELEPQVPSKGGRKNGKKDDIKLENNDDHTTRKSARQKSYSRYPTVFGDGNSSEEELWEEPANPVVNNYEDRDFFFDSDDDNDFDNELLQNSDEDTEDASETDMATLEEEISEMKQKMYQEKIEELKEKLEEIKNKTLPQYVYQLDELKRVKEDWIKSAKMYKEQKQEEIENEYELEKRLAKEDFERKKFELKEIIINELNEKKKTIEIEKSTLELTSGVASILPLEMKPVVTRKLRRRPNEPPPAAEKKRKTTSTQLNFLLTEDEIACDLRKIMKHLKSPMEEKVNIKSTKSDKCDPSEFPDGSDTKIKDDKLYFNKEWYESGDPIYLKSKDGEKFNAQIHSISSTREIWIKKPTEGTRLKIYVGHLQRGKYSLEKRDVVPSKKV